MRYTQMQLCVLRKRNNTTSLLPIYRYHNLYNQMFVSNKFFILYTRNVFSTVKTTKKGPLKVFDKYTKSNFSNFEYGRSSD